MHYYFNIYPDHYWNWFVSSWNWHVLSIIWKVIKVFYLHKILFYKTIYKLNVDVGKLSIVFFIPSQIQFFLCFMRFFVICCVNIILDLNFIDCENIDWFSLIKFYLNVVFQVQKHRCLAHFKVFQVIFFLFDISAEHITLGIRDFNFIFTY